MNIGELNKLRQYYHSIRGIIPVLEEKKGRIDHYSVESISDEVGQLLSDFPGIVPTFDPMKFYTHESSGTRYYDVGGLRSYLSRVIGRLQIEIEQKEDTPVTQRWEFGYVRNPDLRYILERDYAEAQRAFIGECWKSVIVLAGGMIEAILSDLLLTNRGLISSANKSPKNSDVTRWDLADLINVAVELKLVSSGVEKLSHPIREFRNLIHPGNEIRNNLQFGQEESRIALEVLKIVHRDLS